VGDHPAAGGLRADEIESSRGGPVSEQARAIAQDDGVDEQAILVGEALPAVRSLHQHWSELFPYSVPNSPRSWHKWGPQPNSREGPHASYGAFAFSP
jgi:hypothetical protein